MTGREGKLAACGSERQEVKKRLNSVRFHAGPLNWPGFINQCMRIMD